MMIDRSGGSARVAGRMMRLVMSSMVQVLLRSFLGVERASGTNASGRFAPREHGRLFQADALDERIGMPMRQPPFGSFAAIDECDAQRPILGRQTSDLDACPFDDREDHHVGRAVRLD